MLVAVCDQVLGTSTSSWRKMVTPFSFPMSAVRFSHSTASKGDFLPSVKYLGKGRPRPVSAAVLTAGASVVGEFPLNACFTVAIRSSALPGFPPKRREPYYFTPLRRAEACASLRQGVEQNTTSIREPRERRKRKKDDCQAVVLR